MAYLQPGDLCWHQEGLVEAPFACLFVAWTPSGDAVIRRARTGGDGALTTSYGSRRTVSIAGLWPAVEGEPCPAEAWTSQGFEFESRGGQYAARIRKETS